MQERGVIGESITPERAEGEDAVEFFGPAIELVKTGSPYISGGMVVALLAGVYIRELRRHYAAEALTRQERYDELKARYDKLEGKCEATTASWLATERELATVIRDSRSAARKAGAP